MDFSNDDELDYEEDDLENDSAKNDLENNSVGDEVNQNVNLSEAEDQYLQVNCSEEEKNFIEKAYIENNNIESDNVIKANKEGEKPEPEKPPPPSPVEENLQTKNSSADTKANNKSNVKINEKCKEKGRTFRHKTGAKKQVRNPFSFNQWFPKWNLSNAVISATPPGIFEYSDQTLNIHKDIYSNPSSSFPSVGFNAAQQNQYITQIMPANHRFLQSQPFSSSLGMGVGCNFIHQRNKPFAYQLAGLSFYKNRSNFQFENDQRIFSKRAGLENIKPNVIKRQDKSMISSSEQKFSRRRRKNVFDNFRSREGKKNGFFSFRNVNTDEVGANGFNEFGKSESSLFQWKCSLKNEERELMKLKKEARLKRFMIDEVVQKESKFSYSTCENEIQDSVHIGQEYLKKIEEQKLTRENLQSPTNGREKKTISACECNPYISSEKPDINKESLMRKRNPFDLSLKTSNCMLNVKIKEEKERLEDVKQEISDSRLLVPISEKFLKQEETKPISESSEQRFGVFRNGAGFPVKFVRTVSKSFAELALRKPKMALPDIKDELPFFANTVPLVAANKMIFSTNDFPAQVESQLTGCIVKVFNIPPSITTNDVLALCSPIGIVKEIKINLPKENSVVIRFAEPSCAENFFSVYHGQKMNNYFLNVIVV